VADRDTPTGATEWRDRLFWLQRLHKNETGKVYALSWHSYKTSYRRDVWAGRYRRMGDEVRYGD
jgi:hypothetical protein